MDDVGLSVFVTKKSHLAAASSPFNASIHSDWALYGALVLHLPGFVPCQTLLVPTLSNILRGRPGPVPSLSSESFTWTVNDFRERRRRN